MQSHFLSGLLGVVFQPEPEKKKSHSNLICGFVFRFPIFGLRGRWAVTQINNAEGIYGAALRAHGRAYANVGSAFSSESEEMIHSV